MRPSESVMIGIEVTPTRPNRPHPVGSGESEGSAAYRGDVFCRSATLA